LFPEVTINSSAVTHKHTGALFSYLIFFLWLVQGLQFFNRKPERRMTLKRMLFIYAKLNPGISYVPLPSHGHCWLTFGELVGLHMMPCLNDHNHRARFRFITTTTI